MRMKEICLLMARRYRKRSDVVLAAKKDFTFCRGMCCLATSMYFRGEINNRQKETLKNYFSLLPQHIKAPVGYKFPTDKTGFLLRAKWLEKLSKKFK